MKTPLWVPIAGVIAVFLAINLYGSYQRGQGRLEGRLEGVVATEQRLAKVVAKSDTVYLARTDTLRRFLTRWDSVRSTDTLLVPVPGKPESVTVYVPRATADTAIQLCTRTLNSCDASLRARDSLLVAQRAHIKGLEALKPSRFGGLLRNVLIFGAGVGAGSLIRR